jgi:tetratricopeptide (TPR) repeat protein
MWVDLDACDWCREAGIKALKEAHEATETALRDAVESAKERHAAIQKAREKQLAEARKQYDELVKREDEEVEKAKNLPPDLGRYLLSKSTPPIRPVAQQNVEESDEMDAVEGDPDDGWTPDPDSPFTNALYYYGSERWVEARSAFEESLEKIEFSQHTQDAETMHGQAENRAQVSVSSPKAVEPEPEAAAEAEPEPELKPEPEPVPEPVPEPGELDSALGAASPSLDNSIGEGDFRARCHNGIGLCCMMQNRFTDGLASFNRAIAADPSAPSAYHNRAKALRELGREEEAEADELKEASLIERAATEPKGWLRVERGIKAVAIFNALRAQLALSGSDSRPSLLGTVVSDPSAAEQISGRTEAALEAETEIEIEDVHGYEGAQKAFSEAAALDPEQSMVPLLGDSHKKLQLKAQLGPIMEMGAR